MVGALERIGDHASVVERQRGGHLVANLRMRAGAIRAFEITPSVRERMLAALPSQRGNSVVVYP